MTWRKGAQYKFECKVKRTKMVDNVPFVDGNRDEGSVQARLTNQIVKFQKISVILGQLCDELYSLSNIFVN